MKLRNPSLIRGAGLLSAMVFRGLMGTLRCRLDCSASGNHPADPSRERYIYAFWHETLLFGIQFRTKIHVMISQHADGELIAQICRHLGLGTVRGSSRRGGSGALLHLINLSKKTHLGITPDGPRGPRRRVQPGVAYLASVTGLPVVPFGVGFANAWRAKSWDRFALPLPYSLATAVGAEPIRVPPGLDLKGLEHYRRLVEGRLTRATEDAERWALGKPRLVNGGFSSEPWAVSA